MSRVGVVMIGQTPRDDLTELLADLPSDHPLEARGALDGFETADLPEPAIGGYPLTTRLRDGTVVSVDERFLLPLVQRSIDYFESADASVIFLMCAGEFNGLHSTLPLFNPFRLTAELLRTVGCKQVAVLVPTSDQIAPADEKWTRAGLRPHVVSFGSLVADRLPPDLGAIELAIPAAPDAVVLDYVGSTRSVVELIKGRVGAPVFDLGHVAAAALRSTLGHRPAGGVTDAERAIEP